MKKHTSVQTLLDKYVNSMTEKERQAYEIARSHLMCSFDLSKSIGFLEFVQQTKATQDQTKSAEEGALRHDL